jgi:Ca2+-binding EF-hand superfamily protein
MKRMALRHIRSQHEKKRIENLLLLFQQYDLDGNGKLDIAEVRMQHKKSDSSSFLRNQQT